MRDIENDDGYIHWMSHDAIRSRGDDFVPSFFLNLDDSREIPIFSYDKDEQDSCNDHANESDEVY